MSNHSRPREFWQDSLVIAGFFAPCEWEAPPRCAANHWCRMRMALFPAQYQSTKYKCPNSLELGIWPQRFLRLAMNDDLNHQPIFSPPPLRREDRREDKRWRCILPLRLGSLFHTVLRRLRTSKIIPTMMATPAVIESATIAALLM
jgi:hypothetical protein